MGLPTGPSTFSVLYWCVDGFLFFLYLTENKIFK